MLSVEDAEIMETRNNKEETGEVVEGYSRRSEPGKVRVRDLSR